MEFVALVSAWITIPLSIPACAFPPTRGLPSNITGDLLRNKEDDLQVMFFSKKALYHISINLSIRESCKIPEFFEKSYLSGRVIHERVASKIASSGNQGRVVEGYRTKPITKLACRSTDLFKSTGLHMKSPKNGHASFPM